MRPRRTESLVLAQALVRHGRTLRYWRHLWMNSNRGFYGLPSVAILHQTRESPCFLGLLPVVPGPSPAQLRSSIDACFPGECAQQAKPPNENDRDAAACTRPDMLIFPMSHDGGTVIQASAQSINRRRAGKR